MEVSAPASAQAEPAHGVQAHAEPKAAGTELGATCVVAGILKPGIDGWANSRPTLSVIIFRFKKKQAAGMSESGIQIPTAPPEQLHQAA